MPEVIDPHVHHWRPTSNPWYPGLKDGALSAVGTDYVAEHYRVDSEAFDVAAIVHVSAATAPRAMLDEVRWIDAMARSTGWPAATIGAIEVDQPWQTIEADLDAQAQSPLFRGIRVLYGLDPDSDVATRLVRRLAAHGYVFDQVSHPHEVPAYLRMLDAVPELTVAIEHAGWPEDTDAEHFWQWRRSMAALAARPNTYCKISGLAMTLDTVGLDRQRPWIEGCLETFGADRCMFASNFPIDKLFGGYAELYETYQAIAAELPGPDRELLFSATARRVYRI